MSPTEIWLRLMAVYSLSGEMMVRAFQRLQNMPDAPAEALRLAGLNIKQRALFFGYPQAKLEAALRWLEMPGHYLLTALSPDYPVALRAIEWFPGALLVAGDPRALNRPQLAVVGSRHHSWYGEQWGSKLCYALVESGLILTSGLALGIDAIAHRSALKAQGKTIAVLGNGLAQVYPARHRKLAEEIVEQGGALVSEFPFEAQPRPAHFPRRNRIISGLSVGVLVVEAALRSGSLVTARCAIEQGREVFALPGPVGNPGCEGPHWLILQGAIAVTHPQDIIDYLQNELPWLKTVNYSPDQEEGALPFPELLANVGDEVTPVDVVAERAGQPVPMTVAQLLELELAGWIAAVPGGYVRVRRAGHVRRTNVFV
ncbi:DNA-protecting protein DprA [Cronobacter turicensis]|uniref:DNA-protecting protein DprA n=1 Tax=Cronobacter turicensis TaxID=413502 RepID=UPI001412CAB1|nr:DNA-protecting protein DprA [Cronobacter turicensis]NHV11604.1 DNA-protecting protein DprA [Cronobacter turicensis]NHV65343.1 DNA-protecting protein DprA [Cronobacter turicensis]NHW12284.1 DNA-protecting protein DprA [Cronobacter turicensis]